MIRKRKRRIVAFVLTVAMVVTLLPVQKPAVQAATTYKYESAFQGARLIACSPEGIDDVYRNCKSDWYCTDALNAASSKTMNIDTWRGPRTANDGMRLIHTPYTLAAGDEVSSYDDGFFVGIELDGSPAEVRWKMDTSTNTGELWIVKRSNTGWVNNNDGTWSEESSMFKDVPATVKIYATNAYNPAVDRLLTVESDLPEYGEINIDKTYTSMPVNKQKITSADNGIPQIFEYPKQSSTNSNYAMNMTISLSDVAHANDFTQEAYVKFRIYDPNVVKQPGDNNLQYLQTLPDNTGYVDEVNANTKLSEDDEIEEYYSIKNKTWSEDNSCDDDDKDYGGDRTVTPRIKTTYTYRSIWESFTRETLDKGNYSSISVYAPSVGDGCYDVSLGKVTMNGELVNGFLKWDFSLNGTSSTESMKRVFVERKTTTQVVGHKIVYKPNKRGKNAGIKKKTVSDDKVAEAAETGEFVRMSKASNINGLKDNVQENISITGLTFKKNNGSVSAEKSLSDPVVLSPEQGTFDLHAEPSEGYAFAGWYVYEGVDVESTNTAMTVQSPAPVDANGRDYLSPDYTYVQQSATHRSRIYPHFRKVEKVATTFLAPIGSGSYTVNGAKFTSAQEVRNEQAGKTYQLAAVPENGYAFSHWEANGVQISESAIFSYKTEEGKPVSIQPVFTKLAKLTIVPDAARGKVTVQGDGITQATIASGSEYYLAKGASLTLTPAETDASYRFDHWSIEESGTERQESTETLTITISDTGQNLRIMPIYVQNGDITFALPEAGGRLLSVTVDGKTSEIADSQTFCETAGTEYSATVAAASGYRFVRWDITTDGQASQSTEAALSIRRKAGQTILVTPVFEKVGEVTLLSADGGSVEATIGDVAAGRVSENKKWIEAVGTTYKFSAVESSETYRFVRWEIRRGDDWQTYSGEREMEYTDVEGGAVSFRPVFERLGTVTITPVTGAKLMVGGSILNYEQQYRNKTGTKYELSIEAEEGYRFDHWQITATKDGVTEESTISGSAFTHEQDADAVVSIRPVMIKLGKLTIKPADGGEVRIDGAAITGDTVRREAVGTEITLEAVAEEKWQFAGWKVTSVKDGTSVERTVSGAAWVYTESLEGDVTAVPVFEALSTVKVLPAEHGKVTVKVNGRTTTIGEEETAFTNAAGTVYDLSAKETEDGYRFVRWEISDGTTTDKSLTEKNITYESKKGETVAILPVFAQVGIITVQSVPLGRVWVRVDGREKEIAEGNDYRLEDATEQSYTVRTQSYNKTKYAFVRWEAVDCIIRDAEKAETVVSVKPGVAGYLYPVYQVTGSAGDAAFRTNGEEYSDLQEALDAAGQNYTTTATRQVVTLVRDERLDDHKTYSVPNGVTLLVPFDAAGTLMRENMTTAGAYTVYQGGVLPAPMPYRTLTLGEGTKLVVTAGGEISVSAKTSLAGGGSPYSATPNGMYGHISLMAGSEIDLYNDAKLYAWGYITGEGKVVAKDSATIYEEFQIEDFKGGTITQELYNNRLTYGEDKGVFPFNQYHVQNIETDVEFHGTGTTERTFMGLWVNTYGLGGGTNFDFIGGDGIFAVRDRSGYIVKKYDAATDETHIETHGSVVIQDMQIDIKEVGLSILAKDFVMPVTNNLLVDVMDGRLSIEGHVQFLPGSALNIAEHAGVTIREGACVWFYGLNDWKGEYGNQWGMVYRPAYYSATGKALLQPSAKGSARLDVNGSLTVEGQLYTTASGANITSTKGKGEITFAAAPAILEHPKLYQKSGTVQNIYTAIAYTEPVLGGLSAAGASANAVYVAQGTEWYLRETVEAAVEPVGSAEYNGRAHEPSVTVRVADVEGAVMDVSEYTVTYENNVSPGTATITVRDNPGGRYSFETVTSQFAVTKRMLSVNDGGLEEHRKTYDGVPARFCVVGSDDRQVDDEIARVIYFRADGTRLAGAPADAGTYTAKVEVMENRYYESSGAEETFTIDKRPLGVTVLNKSIDYGENLGRFGFGFTNSVGAASTTTERFASELALETAYQAGKSIGTYEVGIASFDDANYTLGEVTKGTLTVEPKHISLVWDDTDIIGGIDGKDVTAAVRSMDIIGEDEVTVVVTGGSSARSRSEADEDGKFTATAELLVNGAPTADYVIDNPSIRFTISEREAHLTLHALQGSHPEIGYSGEDVRLDSLFTIESEPVKDDSGKINITSVIEKDGETVSAARDAGAYEVTVTLDATELGYAIAREKFAFTITPAPLKVTAKDEKIVYGDEVPEYALVLEGVKNGDSESELRKSVTVSCDYACGSGAGSYPITVGELENTNYTLEAVDGTLTVGPKKVAFLWDWSGEKPAAEVRGTVGSDYVKAVLSEDSGEVIGLEGVDAENYALPDDVAPKKVFIERVVLDGVTVNSLPVTVGEDTVTAKTSEEAELSYHVFTDASCRNETDSEITEPGIYYVRANLNGQESAVAMSNVAKFTVWSYEEAPEEARADYTEEAEGVIKGLDADKSYLVDGKPAVKPSAEDKQDRILIQEDWYERFADGDSVVIPVQTKGNGVTTLSSEVKMVRIAARPEAPADEDFGITKCTESGDDGSIMIQTAGVKYQYRKAGAGDAWIDVGDAKRMEGLLSGVTYEIRKAAGDGSPASKAAAIKMTTRQVVSITMGTLPETEVIEGLKLSLEGGTFIVNYDSGGSAEKKLSKAEVTYDTGTAGEKAATVSFEGAQTTFAIKVIGKLLSGLEKKSDPSKTVYEYGEKFDPTGLALKATFNNGTSTSLTGEVCEILPDGPLTMGTTEVVVRYSYGWSFEEIEIPVTVVKAKGMVTFDGKLHKIYDKEAVKTTGFQMNTHGSDGKSAYEFYESDRRTKLNGAPVKAGKYYVRALLAEGTNYTAAESELAEYVISPKTLNITWKNVEQRESGDGKKALVSLSGLCEGDDVIPVIGGDNTDGAGVHEVSLTLEGDDAGNYIVDEPNMTFVVAEREEKEETDEQDKEEQNVSEDKEDDLELPKEDGKELQSDETVKDSDGEEQERTDDAGTEASERQEDKDAEKPDEEESQVVELTTEKDGTVTAETSFEIKSIEEVTLSGDVFAEAQKSAGKKDVDVTIHLTRGDEAVADVTVNAGDVKKGAVLTLYALDKKGNLVMVGVKTQKIGADKNISLNVDRGNYVLLNAADAKKQDAKIAKTVKLKETKATVKTGKKTKVSYSGKLNMDNVKKISYTSGDVKKATVSRKGVVKAKRSGTVKIKATVVLKNGMKKNLVLKITIKK